MKLPSPIFRPLRRRLSFRAALLGLVLGSLLCTVGGIAIAAYLNGRSSTEDLKQKHYGLLSQAMSLEVRRLLEPAQRILVEYQTLARRGMLPLDDSEALGLRLAEGLRARPFLGWLSYSDAATGGFVGARRQEDGTVVLNQSSPMVNGGRPRESIVEPDGPLHPLKNELPGGYDPRAKPWFRRATETQGLVWSEPYRFHEGESGITASLAYYIPGTEEATGVFTADFFLSGISKYLQTIMQERRGLAVVFTQTGEVIGSSYSLRGAREEFMKATLQALPQQLATLHPGEPVRFQFQKAGEVYDAVFSAFALDSGFHYIAGVVGPEAEFLGVVTRNTQSTFLIGAMATALAAALAVLFASRIAHPLKLIADDMQEVGQFHLSNEPGPGSWVREIAVVWESSARMKAGLRSFGRYVPTELVRELLSQGEDAALGAQNRTLTLFFSDIEGFTNWSEQLSPEEVFAELGEYLELATGIIETTSGTLDKFIGDGLLAFYNAPNFLADHAIRACTAALQLQQKLEALSAARTGNGRPVFRTRIGLHTGEVMVGNIGTRERFSYTAIGDGVNLASRLENLNKTYGTWILASEATVRETGDAFEWRMIDLVAVSGRSSDTLVFELLGKKGRIGESLARARDAYEEGLRCLSDGRTGEAIAHFQSVHELQPQDVATAVMLARASNLTERSSTNSSPAAPQTLRLIPTMGPRPR